MEGAWARRVYLISLRRLNLVPCIGLLKHVRVRPTNDACAVEKRCVEALLARRITAYQSGHHVDSTAAIHTVCYSRGGLWPLWLGLRHLLISFNHTYTNYYNYYLI